MHLDGTGGHAPGEPGDAVLTPAPGVSTAGLSGILREFYDQPDVQIDFVPLGEDSWCYRSADLWVSLRRDIDGHVPEAYLGACELAGSGLDYVLAPIPGSDGQVVRDFAGYPLVVFPFRHVQQIDADSPLTMVEREVVLEQLRQLQTASVTTRLPTEDFSLPFERRLSDARARLAQGVSRGPFSRRAEALADRHADRIDRWCREIDEVARRCRRTDHQFVLSHGDPSGANFLRSGSDLLLADWGALRWAPRERDTFHLTRTLGFPSDGRADFTRFYELRWALSEVAEYLEVFSSDHVGTVNDQAMWGRLLRYLPALDSSLEPLENAAREPGLG